MYALDQHFRRFLNSAAMAGIPLSMTQAQMYRAIMETAAASEKMDCAYPAVHQLHDALAICNTDAAHVICPAVDANCSASEARLAKHLGSMAAGDGATSKGIRVQQTLRLTQRVLRAGHLRFWLSAGRGGFALSTRECLFSSFYVVAYTVPEPPLPRCGGRRSVLQTSTAHSRCLLPGGLACGKGLRAQYSELLLRPFQQLQTGCRPRDRAQYPLACAEHSVAATPHCQHG